VWTQVLASRGYTGLAEWDWTADYADPDTFLALFTSRNPNNSSGWRDEVYDAMLAGANADPDRSARMQKLADCETYLLRSMPLIPLYFDVWTYLQKPFVRGLETDPLAGMTFQNAWIDTNWRPS
jgi:oligopeptide transport system substrate-binding protein